MCRAMADRRLVAVAEGRSDSVAATVEELLLAAARREEEELVGSRRGKAIVCGCLRREEGGLKREGARQRGAEVGGARRAAAARGGASQGHTGTASRPAAHGIRPGNWPRRKCTIF